ncbi:MAG: hypothetical protein EBT75_06740 [Proteobacteria bacterium]|nr:hypothetical protein [Pseudomonadota bacterium]NBS50515.1 hypothetical protein [Verrucomicrobiota bacterium]
MARVVVVGGTVHQACSDRFQRPAAAEVVTVTHPIRTVAQGDQVVALPAMPLQEVLCLEAVAIQGVTARRKVTQARLYLIWAMQD